MLEQHVMPTPPLHTYLLTQVCLKALPSVFDCLVLGGLVSFGEFGWTPVRFYDKNKGDIGGTSVAGATTGPSKLLF